MGIDGLRPVGTQRRPGGAAVTAPGLSPIYAAARDMLAALDAGNAAGHYFDGTLCARIVDGGNYRALTLDDVRRIERDTLAQLRPSKEAQP